MEQPMYHKSVLKTQKWLGELSIQIFYLGRKNREKKVLNGRYLDYLIFSYNRTVTQTT